MYEYLANYIAGPLYHDWEYKASYQIYVNDIGIFKRGLFNNGHEGFAW